jgi:hypothetical protein
MLLRPVLEYLWGVHKNLIHPVPFPVPPPPQAPADNRSTWDLIAGDIRVIRDATERQHLREAATEDAKKRALQ